MSEDDVEATEYPMHPIKRRFHNVSQQQILMRIAKSCTDTDGSGLYILYEVVMMLHSRAEGDPLRKAWGKDFDKKWRQLKLVGTYLSQLNHYWRLLDEKKIKGEGELTNPAFLRYRNLFVKVSYSLDILYETFYLCLDNTDIKNLDILTEYWRKLEGKLEG